MSHINKLGSLQSKILRTIVNAQWYVKNEDIRFIMFNTWIIQGSILKSENRVYCNNT